MRRLMTPRTLRLPMALAALLSVFGAGQPTASAHDDKVFHGKDFALVQFSHTQVNLCDEEKDGHYVYAQVRYGTAGLGQVKNTNGADGNCVVKDFSARIRWVEICEETKGCYRENV
jgi:hypothetical protein